jgi:hypothetical protein
MVDLMELSQRSESSIALEAEETEKKNHRIGLMKNDG